MADKDWISYRHELSDEQKLALDKANDYAIERYFHHRRRGVPTEQAYEWALAWGINASEQAARRCAHDTGCDRRVSWRISH